MPLLAFDYENSFIELRSHGLGVEADFIPALSFQAGPLARYGGGRDNDVDNAAVVGSRRPIVEKAAEKASATLEEDGLTCKGIDKFEDEQPLRFAVLSGQRDHFSFTEKMLDVTPRSSRSSSTRSGHWNPAPTALRPLYLGLLAQARPLVDPAGMLSLLQCRR